jgi:hypothetical protein
VSTPERRPSPNDIAQVIRMGLPKYVDPEVERWYDVKDGTPMPADFRERYLKVLS